MMKTATLASNARTMSTIDVDNAINNGVTMNDQWFEVRRYNTPSYDAYQNADVNDVVLLTEAGSVYTFLKEVQPKVVEVISTTEKHIPSNTPNGLICKLSDGRHLWVAMMSTSSGKDLCYPMGLTHMQIFETRDCCFMDDTEYTGMVKELKKILKEAYALTSYDTEEVSIGTESLIYDDTSDFPIDGYAYATHVWEEGNCGVYHSIEWLENLLKEMVQAAREVHIKDSQMVRDMMNDTEYVCDQVIDDTMKMVVADKVEPISEDIIKSWFVDGYSEHEVISQASEELLEALELFMDRLYINHEEDSNLEGFEQDANRIKNMMLFALNPGMDEFRYDQVIDQINEDNRPEGISYEVPSVNEMRAQLIQYNQMEGRNTTAKEDYPSMDLGIRKYYEAMSGSEIFQEFKAEGWL